MKRFQPVYSDVITHHYSTTASLSKPTLFMILLCGIASFCTAQELPPFRNFTVSEYGGQNQNWDISQSQERLIYIANNEGLLEYNGARWTLYPSPNETIMRSVEVINNRIYTGCYMEFGYWLKNSLGVLEYTSISQALELNLTEDEEFWNIFGIEDWVIFQSLNNLYIYSIQNESIEQIEAEGEITKMYMVDESIYFQIVDKGVFAVRNGQKRKISNHEILKKEEVVNILPSESGILIITRNNGFFHLKDGILNEWKSANESTAGLSIYSAIRSTSGNYILGTISNGLIFMDQAGNKLFEINQDNGLNNNTVLTLHEDVDANIWAGLDNGLSLVNVESPINFFKDESGSLGSIYSSIIYEGRLYLGSNQGLFFKDLTTAENFHFINGTEGQVWRLKVIDGTLFCGHHRGTFTVKGERAELISNIPGTWDLIDVENMPETIIQGNYDGLYVLKKENNRWRYMNKIEGFNNSSRYFEILGNTIFVNHEYKGVFQLTFDDSLNRVEKVSIDTLLKSANSGLSKFNGHIYYASKEGILWYNKNSNTFEVDSTLTSIFMEDRFLSGRMVHANKEDEYWLFTENQLSRITTGNLVKTPVITRVPIHHDTRNEVVEFENMVYLAHNQYLIGTSYGYMTFNLNQLAVADYSVSISEVINGIKYDQSTTQNRLNWLTEGSFDDEENNLYISFYAPTYLNYYTPTYQFRLIGLYDEWSNWSLDPFVFFENLPPGNYTFHVRAKVGNKISENLDTYNFSIAKPWYATHFMIAVYIFCVLILGLLMNLLYRRNFRKKARLLINENKRALEVNRLQAEKEIIRIKNEQLQKEYKNKSKELAASTMSIIKKNEVLNQIKEELLQIENKSTIKPVIKTIDKNLNQHKNWELFQEAFKSADHDFFKKIKEVHPDLSPNDLKLCAYLRLNLSSKEISGLINISPRSVEVKRYRLRKKLQLDNNEHLTNYIMNI